MGSCYEQHRRFCMINLKRGKYSPKELKDTRTCNCNALHIVCNNYLSHYSYAYSVSSQNKKNTSNQVIDQI